MLASPLGAFQASGTDGERAGDEVVRAVNAKCAEGENRRLPAVLDRVEEESPSDSKERNVLPQNTLGVCRHKSAKSGKNRPGRGRTYDQGIMSPLL